MTVFLIPTKEDIPVRKSDGEFLDAQGEFVERSSFWVRRLNDGDVKELDGTALKKYQDELKKAAEAKAKADAQLEEQEEQEAQTSESEGDA
ncbi:DUF2635 domain-containing protein [Enterovibrio nigricans]|uniref:DUF2635 domain-containing protein n=1 Tax=Enterovibrio nigricans DSM 22720 TaxID=1121868 RepID=A0A1T4VXZ5_9GAMM|nr:DUF2635 domain-containing protein [Enterovibrio nigricans]PKF49255.1 DUF2635 domain-containing protein [Enterovibrio nigricans]SKA69371.1 Protein of unknown function [Enterovibrio nigricans DSM 22720]